MLTANSTDTVGDRERALAHLSLIEGGFETDFPFSTGKHLCIGHWFKGFTLGTSTCESGQVEGDTFSYDVTGGNGSAVGAYFSVAEYYKGC